MNILPLSCLPLQTIKKIFISYLSIIKVSLHNPEIGNLILYSLKNPTFAIKSQAILCKKVAKKFVFRTSKRFNNRSPRYLNNNCVSQQKDIPIDKGNFRKPDVDRGVKTIKSLKLAGINYPMGDSIQWEGTFKDREDFESLHRWNWLLLKLTDDENPNMLADWGAYHVCDWIEKHIEHKNDSQIWSTYTTGERICNLLIFLEKTGLECNSSFKQALNIMASHVLSNLEYYGEKGTFNHFINNARALYFAGQYLGIEFYSNAARKILQNELHKLITNDGFLREGSSHYHFLFTRWLLEILCVAKKFGDCDTVAYITPYVQNLIDKCWFFLVFDKKKSSWSIPLIGDISPDFSPEWLLTLPWSRLAISLHKPLHKKNIPKKGGWSLLFDNDEIEIAFPGFTCNNVSRTETIQSYGSSGWYRFDFNSTTLFLHVEPEGIPEYPGHFHSDTCSFCLYRDGSPVLIDAGRRHYINDDVSKYALSARSHNSVQIDGLDPFPDIRYLGFYDSICGKPIVTWSEGESNLLLEIKHMGFSRIHNDKIVHIRKLTISFSQVVIEDCFYGNTEHYLETFFHWAPGLKLEKTGTRGQFNITGYEERYSIRCESTENIDSETSFSNTDTLSGWYSPKYGVKIPIYSLIYKSTTAFPITQQYVIRWC